MTGQTNDMESDVTGGVEEFEGDPLDALTGSKVKASRQLEQNRWENLVEQATKILKLIGLLAIPITVVVVGTGIWFSQNSITDSISEMNESIRGLPTSLASVTGSIQNLSGKIGKLNEDIVELRYDLRALTFEMSGAVKE